MTRQHRPSRRAFLTGAALLGAATLTGCGLSGSEPETTPATSAPTSLRDRLVAGLQITSPSNARLVENPQTRLTPVTAEWLSGWQILDVLNSTGPHPQRFFVALSDSGRAEVLTGRPDAFSTLLTAAGVRIDSTEVAGDVGEVFLDVTRDFRVYAYRVDSVDDIEWIPRPSAAEQAARDQLLTTYRGKIQPTQVAGSGDGWQVSIWMVQGRDLMTHELGIASGTPIADQAKMIEKDIPVPYSA